MYQNHPQSRNNPPNNPREPVVVVGVPSITIDHNRLVVGNANTSESLPNLHLLC
jgi:meiosis induction protein kinase IME2/SME1